MYMVLLNLILRRLDNARLAAIHPFSPLIMKGAAPASSRKQLSRPRGAVSVASDSPGLSVYMNSSTRWQYSLRMLADVKLAAA